MKGTIKIGVLLILLLVLIMPHISAIEYYQINSYFNNRIIEEKNVIEHRVDLLICSISKILDSISLLKNNVDSYLFYFFNLFIWLYIIFPIIGAPTYAFGMILVLVGIINEIPILIRIGYTLLYIGQILLIPFQITFRELNNKILTFIAVSIGWLIDLIRDIFPLYKVKIDAVY
jgi:hypothetical protein